MTRIPKLTTTLAYDRYMAGQKRVSSADRPWRHLVLRSYLEPEEQELLEAPGLRDLTLMTLASGAEHLERNLNGRWESAELRMGDVGYVPPAPFSWRWRSISDEPLSTVHVHIERSLIDSMADQMELDGPRRELSLGDAMQFHDPRVAAMLAALHRAATDPADSRLFASLCRCAGSRARRASSSAVFARSAHGRRTVGARQRDRRRSPNGWCRAASGV